jgi:hypothetical protein
MFRRHGPILKTAGAAIAAYLGAFASAAGVVSRTSGTPADVALPFLLGLLYTQIFEYAAHRFAMHRGIPLLSNVRLNHLEHHRVFHGDRFRSRTTEDLEHIPGRWWFFPLLLGIHYLPATALLTRESALGFLLGSLVHYLFFETTHWFTHIEDNALDRVLERIPVLGSIRAAQIEHHRAHHQIPIVGFNFNPPYLGDRLTARMPTRGRLRSLGVRDPRPRSRPALVPTPLARGPLSAGPARTPPFFSRPLARYGTAALLGVAALGLAVAAHGFWTRDARMRRGLSSSSHPEVAKA